MNEFSFSVRLCQSQKCSHFWLVDGKSRREFTVHQCFCKASKLLIRSSLLLCILWGTKRMCLSQSCLSECRPFIVPILYLAPSLPGIGLSSPGVWDLHGMRISSLGGAKVCCMYVSNTRFLFNGNACPSTMLCTLKCLVAIIWNTVCAKLLPLCDLGKKN